MLKRKFRLPKDVEFKSKIQSDTPLFFVRVSKNNLDYSRFGFVVSKKVDKRAVVRNRNKRLLRSAVEKNLDKFPKGFDILFSAKEEIGKKGFEEIKKEVEEILEELKNQK